ncbi:MAG: ribosome-associated translation inhibitor RaiA [Rickettsiales bacterium]
MQVIVSGQNIEIGDSIRHYAEEHIQPTIGKYFENAVRSHVTLHKSRHLFSCDILVNEGTGRKITVRAHAESGDPYVAFTQCLHKIEKQLRRYKRKLTHSHRPHDGFDPQLEEALAAKAYVIASNDDNEDGHAADISDAPVTVAEGAVDIPEMTVGEAVMRMDLEDLYALMFVNRKNGHISMVHRRQDGNIGWVDSNKLATDAGKKAGAA